MPQINTSGHRFSNRTIQPEPYISLFVGVVCGDRVTVQRRQ